MARKLTKKQEGFAKDYLDTGNGTQAALNNYDTEDENTAAVLASKLIRNDKVMEYFKSNASAVSANMVRLALNAENEGHQIQAGKDVLDRAGYKPVDKSEVIIDEKVNTKDPALQEAVRLLKEKRLKE